MIEVIYKEEKAENDTGERLFSIPRNIRRLDLPVETAEFISKIMFIHFLEDWQEGRAERKVAQLLCLRVR